MCVVVFQLILEFRDVVEEYILKMGSPKEDIIGDIDNGLSFIADQLSHGNMCDILYVCIRFIC